MKSILSLAMLILITSCGEKRGDSESSKVNASGNEEIAKYMEVMVGVSGEDSASSSETNLLIESFEEESVVQTVTFRNTTRVGVNLTDKIDYSSLLAEGVEITNGCNKMLPRLQNCNLELRYTPTSGSSSVIGTINFGSSFILSVDLVNLGIKEETFEDKIYLSRDVLDFGSFYDSESKTELITVKNTTRGDLTLPSISVDNSSFSLNNFCPETLPRLASCRLEIIYTAPESILVEESVSGNLNVGNLVVPLSALNAVEDTSCQPVAGILWSGVSGDPKIVNLETETSLSVIVRNRTRNQVELCKDFGEMPEYFQISGCENEISRFGTCQLTFSKTTPPANASHQVLINGEAFLIQTGEEIILNRACNLGDIEVLAGTTNAVSFVMGEVVGEDLSQCYVSECDSGFSLDAENLLNGKTMFCLEDPIICTIENATNLILDNALTVSGNVPSCLVQTCSEGFQPSLDQLSCELIPPVERVCEVNDLTNPLNVLTASGTVIDNDTSSCMVQTCESGFFVENNSCLPNVVEYNLIYQGWGNCSVSTPCSGTGTEERIAICEETTNGVVTNTNADMQLCEEPILSQSCNSPAGDLVVPIDNGIETYSCLEAQIQSEVTPVISCDEGFNLENEACLLDIVINLTPSSILLTGASRRYDSFLLSTSLNKNFTYTISGPVFNGPIQGTQSDFSLAKSLNITSYFPGEEMNVTITDEDENIYSKSFFIYLRELDFSVTTATQQLISQGTFSDVVTFSITTNSPSKNYRIENSSGSLLYTSSATNNNPTTLNAQNISLSAGLNSINVFIEDLQGNEVHKTFNILKRVPIVWESFSQGCVKKLNGQFECFQGNLSPVTTSINSLSVVNASYMNKSAGYGPKICVIISDGKLFCENWGHIFGGSLVGQMGEGPGLLFNSSFDSVYFGGWNSCALRSSDKRLICWEELFMDITSPTLWGTPNIREYFVAGSNVCRLDNNNVGSCSNFISYTTTAIDIAGQVSKFAGVFGLMCAQRLHDNKLFCMNVGSEINLLWGILPSGQVEIGGLFENQSLDKIVIAPSHSVCGILSSNKNVYCFGRTSNGMLGNPIFSGNGLVLDPVPVLGPLQGVPVRDIMAMDGRNCAITEVDGKLYCWGGTGVNAHIPTLIK